MSTETNAMPTADAAPEGSGVAELNKENLDPNFSSESSIEAPTSKEALQEAVQEAVDNGATKEEIKQMIKEYEIKVNGKNKKVKIDLSNEKEVIRALQMAYAGQSAMQEKAELEKMMNQALMSGKQDPAQFLKEYLGIDPDDYAERRIQDRIEEMKKSPEQLEKERIEKEVMKLREELAKKEKAAQEEQMIRMQQQAAYQLDQEITEALQNDPELPKTKKTVRRIADALLWALEYTDENGNKPFKDATVKDILPSVKKDIKEETMELLSSLPTEDLLESYIGKNALDRLRKKRVAAAKQVPTPADVKSVVAPKKEEARQKVDAKDFFRKLARGE